MNSFDVFVIKGFTVDRTKDGGVVLVNIVYIDRTKDSGVVLVNIDYKHKRFIAVLNYCKHILNNKVLIYLGEIITFTHSSDHTGLLERFAPIFYFNFK